MTTLEIILILIVAAGLLNFIVLYNLTNINIQERKSEIATIKVLGFRKNEVYDYIFRENDILSIIGSLLGMLFGYLIHGFIMDTIKLKSVLDGVPLNTPDVLNWISEYIKEGISEISQ